MGQEELALDPDGDITEVALAPQDVQLVQQLLTVTGGIVGKGLDAHVFRSVTAGRDPIGKQGDKKGSLKKGAIVRGKLKSFTYMK